MSRQFSPLAVVSLLLTILAIGCRPQQPFYFHENGDLSHYVGVATNIDYPDVQNPSLDDVKGALPPLSLSNPVPKQMWDLPLQNAMDITLRNSKVFRNLGGVAFGGTGVQGDPTALQSQPTAIPSIYDPARAESDPRYGVEGALAAFDAQFNASIAGEHLDTPQNTTGLIPRVDSEDLGTFQATLSKTTAEGGTFALTNNTGYQLSNGISRATPSDWTTNFVAQFRQPLLQGAGAEFNRIAGPGAIPGFYNGVMIARLRTDVALTEFEKGVRDLARDVERSYWELYFAYRQLDAAIAGRDSALQTWRQVYAKFLVGGKGGSAQEEAQARQQYFTFRTVVEESLSNLYHTESTLRYLMGIAPTDGRLIRPSDEPTTAKVEFDWYTIHSEAIVRSVELRQQKFVIKQRELELIASKNFLLPQLNAIGQYRWLGLGHDLTGSGTQTFDNFASSNALGSLASGQFQEWQAGLELSMPIGFRREMAGVRNAQLNLARDRAVLQEQELELTTGLTNALRQVSDQYVITGSNLNRRIASEAEVKAVKAAYEQGVATLDLLLLAQQRLAEAERAYYRSLIDYTEAISAVHYRKGSLLEYDGIMLAEGPWPNKAYFDATRLARARDASYYLNYGYTRPRVITRGPVNQDPPSPGMSNGGAGAQPELVPTPAPEPQPSQGPETLQPIPAQQTAVPAGQRRLTQRSAAPVRRTSAPQGRSEEFSRLEMDPLGATSPTSAGTASSAGNVQPVSYQQAVASDGWRSTTPSSPSYESVANPTSANPDRTASGWKGVQR